jgi:prevent-host-death family protein
MRTVGVRELKTRLSQYLRDVQVGDVLLVTNRGRVSAELRSPLDAACRESVRDEAWHRLATSHPLRVGATHDPSAYIVSPLRAEPGTARALLDEVRDES